MNDFENAIEIKEHIAAVFDELPFHDDLNAHHLSKILSGIYKNWDGNKFKEYTERLGLPEKKKFGKFSKGMKMKMQISAALSHNARLLIMDEATTGLDPVVRNEILDIFLEYLQDENNSILMSSHITSDLEKIADSITFIDKGKLLLSGYKDDILENHCMLKCTRTEYAEIDKNDIVSARITDFGVSAMTSHKAACQKKYSGIVTDSTTLEEIMLYYVNAAKKEWT